MGNYKFKVSDMIPNAWFYKLRDMNRAKKNSKISNKKTYLSQPRRSFYHSTEPIKAYKFFNSPTNPKFSDTHFPDYPRKSSAGRSTRKTIYKPSPKISTSSVSKNYENACPRDYLFSSSESSDNEFCESPFSVTKSNSMESRDLCNELSSWSSSCRCRITSSTTDIIIDVSEKSSVSKKIEKLNGFDSFSDIQLRPIVTKPAKYRNENTNFRKQLEQEQSTLSVKIVKESSIRKQKQKKTSPDFRKSVSNSTGLKLKPNSPKIVNNKIQTGAFSPKQNYKEPHKKSFSKSFAIVKSSFHPERDFRDSMVEMIVENGISASKDLEELLACYLSLNSDEYHAVIVKAFEQIWFEMASLKL